MLKGIAKAVAYFKAPMKTFTLLHPLKAVKWGGIFLLVGAALKKSGGKDEARDRRRGPPDRRRTAPDAGAPAAAVEG